MPHPVLQKRIHKDFEIKTKDKRALSKDLVLFLAPSKFQIFHCPALGPGPGSCKIRPGAPGTLRRQQFGEGGRGSEPKGEVQHVTQQRAY